MEKQFSVSKFLAYLSGKDVEPTKDFKAVVNVIGELAQTGRFDVEEELCALKRRIRRAKLVRLYRYSAVAAVVCVVAGLSFFLLRHTHRQAVYEPAPQVVAQAAATPSDEVELLVPGKGKMILPESGKATVEAGNELHVEEGEVAYLSFKQDSMNKADSVPAVEHHVLRIPRTKNYKLELADGSRVYLNSETELVFPNRFEGGERRVVLKSGEAFFEIARNPEMPFRVEVEGAELQVLGTSFNVNCYTERVATTLVEGSLKVKSQAAEQLLAPGEQAVSEAGKIEVSEVDVLLYTAWKDGLFVFRRLDLESILKTMQRWYDFNYIFKDEALKKRIFTGVIDKNKDKKVAFQAICKAIGVTITEHDNYVIIE